MLTIEEIKKEFGNEVYITNYKVLNKFYMLFSSGFEITMLGETELNILIHKPSKEKIDLFYSYYKRIVKKSWPRKPKIPLENVVLILFTNKNKKRKDEISISWKKEFSLGKENSNCIGVQVKSDYLTAEIKLFYPIEFDWYLKFALKAFNIFKKSELKFPIWIRKDYVNGNIEVGNDRKKDVFDSKPIKNFIIRKALPKRLDRKKNHENTFT